MGKVVINKTFNENIDLALQISLLELIDKVNEEEVVPFRTGTLQDSATVTKNGVNQVRLTYSRLDYKGIDEIASILYFHPDIKYNKNYNRNAKSRWLDDYINNPSIIKNIIIRNLQQLFN